MRELLEKLIPKEDKLKHDYIGGWFCLLYIPFVIMDWYTWIALVICIIGAGANEAYQKYTKSGMMEIADILFTIRMPLIVFVITML